MRLEGQVVLVTGAARRLGRAIALAVAERGAHVAVHYGSSAAEARGLVRGIRSMGVRAGAFRADLARRGAPERLARRVVETLGPVGALVNSASVYVRTPIESYAAEDWDRILAVNLRAPAILSRNLGLAMKERGSGAIVNLGDWSINRPYPDYAPYAASKAGLESLTRVLAGALAPEVRVNMVSPGAILPPPGAKPAYLRALRKASPMGRMGTAGEIAEAVVFLIEKANYTTGSVLLVDGGRSLR
jgi:NAD(P)-dependent dehydrogenase (short-subunit alcohol dehydrogenase family)